jgi:hypothetical protein
MTLAPMVGSEGVITRQVYRGNPREKAYAAVLHDVDGDGIYHYRDRFGVDRSADTRAPWAAFEHVIERVGSAAFPEFPACFRGTAHAAIARSEVTAGDLFDYGDAAHALPRFDIATAFFVHDSISFEPAVAWKAVDCIINAASRFAIIGQVLNRSIDGGGSGEGYTAGTGTLFPNTAYSRDDWAQFLNGHARVANYKIVESRDDPDAGERFSDGEEGLALIMAELEPLPRHCDAASPTSV